MSKLLCLWELTDEQKASLEKIANGKFEVVYATPKSVTQENAADAEIIFGNISPSLISNSTTLKWLQLNSAGADPYMKEGALPKGTQLTNATGAYGQSVAEHSFAVMLMLMKNLHLYRDDQNKAFWTDEGTVTTPADATVLVMGLGDIGGYFAKLCKAVGSHIIGVKRTPGVKPDYCDELYTFEKLNELLPKADVVFSVLPGTPATTGLWNAEKFSLMKKSAYFINVGRGTAVNQDDLYNALTNGTIKGASIDVTDPEPLPSDSKLWGVRNLILTPHISGNFHLYTTFLRIFEIATNNLANYIAGKQLQNEVDFETGYKKHD